MAGSLFGLGAGTPSRFPYPDRPQPSPGVSPSQGQVVRARFVIVFGSTGGVFVYNGTPGPGNPPIGWITGGTTDPYGNTLPVSGIGEQNANGYVAMLGSVLLMAVTGQASSLAGVIQASGPGEVDVFSPLQTGGDTRAALSLKSTASNGGLGPVVSTFNGAAFNSTDGTVSNPTLVTTDTWHVVGTPGEPAFLNGWANAGGGLASLQFTLTPQKEIHVIGALNPAGLTATQVCTVPAAYRPGVGQDFGLGFHTAAGAGAGIFGRLTTAGALSMINAGVGSGVICVNVKIPLAPTA